MIQRPPQTSLNLEFLGRIRIETDELSPDADPCIKCRPRFGLGCQAPRRQACQQKSAFI
jgi:hypothetical protein